MRLGDLAGSFVEQGLRCRESRKIGFATGDAWHEWLVQHRIGETPPCLV
jgi:hypothetical protein